MWIFLGIILFLALFIMAILMLPIYVTIKLQKNGELYLRYKILNKTFGENKGTNDGISKTIKDALGISRLDKEKLKTSIEKTNFLTTLRENFSLIVDLLKELVGLLKRCKAKVFVLNIICADEDAAQAAISYGECCAVAAPILGYLHSIIDVKPSGRQINISCDYNSKECTFNFETVLMVRVYCVVAALIRIVAAEVKRTLKEKTNKA